jgi:2-keto-4-pentenoate hydratase
MWGAIPTSRIRSAPSSFAAALVPMLGVEPEIAFRLEEEIGLSRRSLTLDEFDRLTSVLPTIEIVDTRFASYEETPVLHRAADFMSNGGLVLGEAWTGLRREELARLEVTVEIGGAVAARVTGGHANGDPRLPALAFLHAPGRPAVIPRGTVITAGSYAGLLRARPGDTVTATFTGHAPISLRFATETDA